MIKDKFSDYEVGRLLPWEKEILSGLEKATARGAWSVKAYEKVGSTMDKAREFSTEMPANTAGLVIAQEQTQGRGRQGRVWQEAHSGFYATYILKSESDLHNFFCLPLVVGLSIAELFASLHLESTIKWPNDVLSLSGKKLSGILIEYLKEGGRNVFLVGVGINLKGEPSAESRAVSIFTETGRVFTPQVIATSLGEKLFSNFKEVEESGFKNFRENWLRHTRGIGSTLSVHVGREIVTGIFRGVGPLGYLLLEVEGVVKEISSGELINDIS